MKDQSESTTDVPELASDALLSVRQYLSDLHNAFCKMRGRHPDKLSLYHKDAEVIGAKIGDTIHYAEVVEIHDRLKAGSSFS